jgi:hypothetical protein
MTGAAPRSVFLQWPLLLSQAERVLDDLATWTGFNTIELSHLYLEGGLRGRGGAAEAAPLALPPEADLDGLPVPTTDAATFESVSRLIELIHARGFRIACNFAPLYIAPIELASFSCVDATGAPVPGHHPQLAVDACPNNPQTVRYAEAVVREFVGAWPTDALTINHVEYALWPETGLSGLFACFCNSCRTHAEAGGIDFGAMQQAAFDLFTELTSPGRQAGVHPLQAEDVLNAFITRPHLAQWLQFRMESMTRFTKGLVRSARAAATQHGRELSLGLECQLPALSRLVGTDFVELADVFDWITPKFPDYLGASTVPFVADEIAMRSGSTRVPELRRAIRELIGLGSGPDQYVPRPDPIDGINYSNTFDLSVFDRQMRHIAPLRGKLPIYPYIWHYDDLDLLRSKVAGLQANGFEGFFLWCGERDLDTAALRAASGIL